MQFVWILVLTKSTQEEYYSRVCNDSKSQPSQTSLQKLHIWDLKYFGNSWLRLAPLLPTNLSWPDVLLHLHILSKIIKISSTSIKFDISNHKYYANKICVSFMYFMYIIVICHSSFTSGVINVQRVIYSATFTMTECKNNLITHF